MTTEKNRTSRISIAMSMSFAAGTLGPFISGFMAQNINHLSVFILIGGSHVMAVISAGIFIRGNEEKENVALNKLFSFNHLINSVKVCLINRTPEEKLKVSLLFLMAIAVSIVTAGELDIAFLYMSDNPLRLPFPLFSYWFGMKFGLGSFALLILLPMFKKCFNFLDSTICFMGLISKMAGLVILGLAGNKYFIFAGKMLY